MSSRHGLGRGLSALLTPSPSSRPGEPGSVQEIPVRAIAPNPLQPRKAFEDDAIKELAASMRRSGVLQPIVVRRQGDGYQLIVGERRWRAAQLAGIERIPAVVREVSNAESLELALVENLLREDLNPMEEAEAYQRLLGEFGWSQDELAGKVGKDRSSVANSLRLLRLPPTIQDDLRSGRLTMGHARALLSLTAEADQLRLRDEILAHSWSVRATEEGVQKRRAIMPPRGPRRSAEISALEDRLRETLAARVRVVGSARRGRIEIVYTDSDELDRLVDILSGRR